MKGWVYIITNKAMPDILKVGFTMKDPELRAIELNHTGSPHPYVVDYEVLVDYPESVEKITHGALSNKREGKEWFRCSREEAIAAIKTATSNKIRYVETFKYADREKAEEVWRSQETERNRKRDAIKRQKEKEEAEERQKKEWMEYAKPMQEEFVKILNELDNKYDLITKHAKENYCNQFFLGSFFKKRKERFEEMFKESYEYKRIREEYKTEYEKAKAEFEKKLYSIRREFTSHSQSNLTKSVNVKEVVA